jgi:hypothetical protein
MSPTILNRPFPVSFETAGAPNVLSFTIDFESPADDVARQGVVEVMTAFAKLGAVGALGGDSRDPGRSGLTVQVNEVTAQGARWVFRDVRIDAASVSVLLNMIHYVHLEDVPVKMVRVAWPGISGLPRPIALRFPALWPKLSFGLEMGELAGDFDIVVKLTEPQSDEVVKHIVDAMSAWLLATHRGAYADDSFNPSRSAVLLGPDVMEVSADRIIWFIDAMRCNESALDALLNVLEWVHQNIAPVSDVEVGP